MTSYNVFSRIPPRSNAVGRFNMEPIEKDWFNKMLEARNTSIDGRPLYAYRITSAEYASLLNILETRCKEPVELDELLEERGFGTLFVFFATEWYKREYIGGPWRWDDIFAKFTTKTVRSPLKRGIAIQAAFKSLKIDIPTDTEGKRFFGAIITNGGLPAKYIQNNTSSLGIVALIKSVLRYALKYVISNPDELYEYIESRAPSYNFPTSLQNESMYKLIIEVVEKIVDLKTRYKLNSRNGVITKLDNTNPEWREEFPILLEDDAIKTLLNTLIQDASEVKVAQKRPTVRRFLNGDSDSLHLDMEISFPTKPVEKDYFVRYFGMPEDLPQTFYLQTWDSNKTRIAKIEADLFNQDVYNILSYNNKLSAADSVILETYSPLNDKDVNGFKLRLAESIDLLDPMVFITDEKGKYVYVGSGDVSVAQSICYIGLPQDVSYELKDIELVNTFTVAGKSFNLYKFEKDIITIGSFEIHLNETTKSNQYVLGGNLLKYRTKPFDAYIGLPMLFYVDDDQNYIKEQRVIYKRHKSDETLPLTSCVGLIDVCCYKNGRTLCKIPVIVLPSEAVFAYDQLDQHGGYIKLKNFPEIVINPLKNDAYTAEVLDESVHFETVNDIPPSTIELGIRFLNGMGNMDIELPFPAKGFGFYNENKECINESTISLNNLLGKRISIFGVNEGCLLRFTSNNQTINKVLNTKDSFAEYRLMDYENDMRFLFNDNEDDIILTLSCNFSRPVRIYVSKYDILTEFHDKNIFVVAKTPIDLSSVHLSAVNLLQRNAQPISLDITTEGIIDTTPLESGLYIICTSQGSDYSIKPVVYRTMTREEVESNYSGLLLAGPKEVRSVLKKDNAPFDSSVWSDVDNLKKLFISKNLSLDSVLLWKCIVNSPELLCRFLFRGTFEKPFLDKTKNVPDAISFASDLVDAQYNEASKILYKMRDELLAVVALLPIDLIKSVITEYRSYFDTTLDNLLTEHIQATCDPKVWDYMQGQFGEQFNILKHKIWDKQYTIIASTFKEISYVLCTIMYEQNLDEFRRIMSLDDNEYKLLQSNMADLASNKKAEDWGNNLFNEINMMLNNYYDGFQIPAPVSSTFVSKCACKDTCKAPLFRFDRFPAERSYVVHFPMFCAWLASQDQEAYLQNGELVHTVRNFIKFHVNYFIEAYRISTIILSKI